MPEKISILKESGETLVSNIVSIFTIPETEKRYIITTENAVDPHGLTVLHVSEIVDGTMQKIATDDEWSTIKTIMRAIISGNVGSYKYLPIISNLSAVGQYSRDISVSASAAKQMIDNYNAGDKSAVSNAVNPVVAPAPDVLQPVAGPITPSTIFPTNGTSISNDDELVPGIAELSSPGIPVPQQPVAEVIPAPVVNPIEVQPAVVLQPVSTPVVPEPQIVAQPVPVVPVAAPTSLNPALVVPESSISTVNLPVLGVESNLPAASVVSPSSQVVPSAIGANTVNIPVTPVIDAQINPTVGVNRETQVTVPVTPAVDNIAVNNDVQVATPTTVIPDAQIVQNAANTSLTNDEQINFNAAPSFDPNATLDEVVVAAQQMFIEGVKNLVVTIQEKVYRDLYSKEEELKNREAAIVQKEQALGLNSPVIGGATVPPVSTAVNPTVVPGNEPAPVVQPTIVQASNDVI